MRIPSISTLLIVLVVVVMAAMAPALSRAGEGVTVTGVRLGLHPDHTRLVFDLDREVAFRVSTISEPYRVHIDFPQVSWMVDPASVRDNRGIVAELRANDPIPGRSRIEVLTRGPARVLRAFLLPDGHDGQTPRFVIDLGGTVPATFALAAGQTLGELPALSVVETVRRPPLPVRKPSRTRYTVVIDAGHGGQDPGAIGEGQLFEKVVTLKVARLLRDRLEERSRYSVVMTRDADIYLALRERVAMSRRAGADLFISLHADSIRRSTTRGASVYTLSETASDEEAELLAARENRADAISGVDLSQQSDDIANILIDLTMRETMNQSKVFANLMVAQMKEDGIQRLRNTHRSAGFAVLKAPDIPSILIEMGYLSSAGDRRLLTDPQHQRRLANVIAAGIDRYFSRVAELRQ